VPPSKGSGAADAIDVKSRRRAGSNSRWDVYLDHVVDGRGNEVPDYLVIEGKFQRPDRVTGVCVLPLVEGRFALIECYRHALGCWRWEAPKGFVDEGEELPEAALRELAEETGLSCARGHLVSLGLIAPEASTLAARGALFAATRCKAGARREVREIGLGRLGLFDGAEMAALAAGAGIEDAATLIAYYRFQALPAARKQR
jgi:ADP-ribose diphosphatase